MKHNFFATLFGFEVKIIGTVTGNSCAEDDPLVAEDISIICLGNDTVIPDDNEIGRAFYAEAEQRLLTRHQDPDTHDLD